MMTETMKRMNAREIAEFIRQMPDNSYASIASEAKEVVDENENIVDYECTGWWSMAKICYADSTTIVFNYYGGGYPYAYPCAYLIDCDGDDNTPENIVERFFRDCMDFGTLDEYFVVDTKINSINAEKK